jgi:hypothetical protein
MADSKPSASSFAAGLPTSQGLSPLQWSDKCFLCGREIGETDPRGFYQGTAAMMLCHRGCLNVMDANGGRPEDYHRAMEQQSSTTAHAGSGGPGWLEFPDLASLQAYVKLHGDIPAQVKVTVAGQAIQG